MGRLGLAPSEAKRLTRFELEAIVKHGTEGIREDWKRTRWLAAILVNVSGKTIKKHIKETELLRFPDEVKSNGFAEFLRAAQDGQRRKE